ncbi:methylglyoxal reductase (NADPH-dependent) gre2 [Neophaeococcomyces mojaviensis]|uniref:Methylglyoxal reductase (NADPH-dependent) gre2 n=1 Tax=Neophaeococcomyces mojaviensis TaxID=3383035 RepID=A0ACC2ZXP0_9EURO|nr:methylglyoxal reductase (NADPH-dependent) gre2 [Knufia sp. JES_112]
MRVLLTGGSGFIAAHCVDYLLQGGHSVVFTVRSHDKGRKILSNHPKASEDQLSYVIVEDIANESAFDEAVKSNPPFEAVLHTASPFHFNVKDPKKDLLDPAIIGTTGILKAIQRNAPSVKRVVITSSFAAIVNAKKHPETYDEASWNPITMDEALHTDPGSAYRGSKTFAEKAAWEFVEKEKPNFTVSTINPPLVLGPVVHYFNSLDSINTSNENVRDFVQGKFKDGLPPTRVILWVDVRDLALAHVRAIERPEAAGKRFFVTAGFFNNAKVADIIKKNFPDLKSKLPQNYEEDPKEYPYKIDNSRSKEVLGLQYRSLEDSITDLVKSLQAAGA